MTDEDAPTLPIFCHYCHGAVTVRYEPGEHQENGWICPYCGKPNDLPM